MKTYLSKGLSVLCLAVLTTAAVAAPLGSSVRPAIPADVQQLISVDYRSLKNSDTAQQLKAQVLPENLKQFETALKGAGIDADRDVDQLTFISYRHPKQGLEVVGAAQGVFATKTILRKLRLKKVRPVKYHDDSNPDIANLIGDVESGSVWSVLDQKGTQNMLFSALGDASRLADYETVKKRILGSRYIMNFSNGINFDLDVMTSDSVTAATLSSLVKAGVLYRKMTASSVEKTALEDVSVNSDSSKLQMHFKADDKQFQSLIHTSLFAAVSR